MPTLSDISEQWILGAVTPEAPINPIGAFEDFDYLVSPDDIDRMQFTGGPTENTTCGTSDPGTQKCTTYCGPIGTAWAGFCGC
jgi:hypothetical protein